MSIITLDFETYYSKDFSLSKMTTESYIRDPQFQVIGFASSIDGGIPHWVTGTEQFIGAALRALDIQQHTLLCHHAAFDGAILGWRYGIRPKVYLDTKSMAVPITGHTKVGASLAKLALHFNLGVKGTEVVDALGKRKQDFGFTDLAQYGEYCKNDVQLTWDLFNVLRPLSTKKEMFIIDMLIRMYTDPVLVFDRPLLEKHLDIVVRKKAALMAKLDATIGKDQLMSNPQLAAVLGKLGVVPPTKISPTTGKETYAFAKTDTAFKELLEHEDIRVQTVAAARLGMKSTLEETRTTSFIGVASRGPLPIMLNYYGAATGRCSGGDKMNLQNMPRGGALRKSILAPAGHKIVVADSAQIEARVVAWLAGQEDLLTDFRNKVDIYSNFASEVYDKPVDRKRKEIGEDGVEFNPDAIEGFVGKTSILGLGYGMGKDRFKVTLKVGQGGLSLDMDIDDCDRTVSLYRAKYSKIAALWKEGSKALVAIANKQVFELGTAKLLCDAEGIHLPNGMVLVYPGLSKEVNGKYAYNSKYGRKGIYGAAIIENVTQALARIVVFDQMCRMDQELRKKDTRSSRYRTALTVHDETVVVVPDAEAQWALDLLLGFMSTPPSWAPDLPVSCEGGIGDNYGEAK